MCSSILGAPNIYIERDRETEKESDKDRERDGNKNKDIHRETEESERERVSDREIEREMRWDEIISVQTILNWVVNTNKQSLEDKSICKRRFLAYKTLAGGTTWGVILIKLGYQ